MDNITEVRNLFEAKLKEIPTEFHPLDLERVKDDQYIKRVLIHQENDVKEAATMLWDILTWRKSIGAADINENTIRMDYIEEGVFFPRGRDIDGCLLLIFKARMHVKGQRDFDELKKIMVYWLDRIEREENGRQVTIFFDMSGSGLSNMDMELIKHLITLFKEYYPYFLNYIIIFEMPWVLSAAFKVVKALLPAKAVERLKFVGKDNLKQVVPPEHALVCWGGMDDYEFEFIPESKTEHPTKKVTFAEQGDNQHSPGEMLRLVPNDTIVFKFENEELSGQFTITNMDDSAISFKIRTTSPEKFRVRPSSGTLQSGSSQTVLIVVQPGFQLRTVTKDRFLVMSVQIPRTDLTQKELADIWQNSTGSKVDEYRLKCSFPEKEIPRNVNSEGKVPETKENLSNLLNHLQFQVDVINNRLGLIKFLQFSIFAMTFIVAVIGYLLYLDTNSNSDSCKGM